jgi:GNAT superfamily N-acetyltransferase
VPANAESQVVRSGKLSPPRRAASRAAAPSVTIREAVVDDLPRIVALLQQLSLDEPREQSEGPLPESYVTALRQIETDPRQRLLVVEAEGRVVATMLLMISPNLSHRGRPWALVDNVAVDKGSRRKGYGEALMRYAVEEARRAGCYKVSLTSDKQRADAHRFYRRLGFTASHEGFRISFDDAHPSSEEADSRSR